MGILDSITGKKKAAKSTHEGRKTAASKKDAKTEETVVAAKAADASAQVQDLKGQSYRILVAPVFTEKTANQQAMGKYTFVVADGATKVDVARAIKDLYGVKPESVRVVNVLGKIVRHGRFSGQRKDVKKAIVSLKKGDSIALAA